VWYYEPTWVDFDWSNNSCLPEHATAKGTGTGDGA
jgi:hypothetical protein